MRLKGVLNLLVFGATSAALTGIVFNSSANRNLFKPVYDTSVRTKTLAIDTPEVDLPYKFEDNQGNEPIYDDKHKLYLENPSNVKTDIQYDPATGEQLKYLQS